VDLHLFWRALVVQGVAVLALFALLVALPLPDGFFRDWGFLVGPAAWAACALATARVLSLRDRAALVAALVGGALGAITLVAVGHSPALLVALVGFATWLGSAGRRSADGEPRRSPQRARTPSRGGRARHGRSGAG
jgi:hypothetical protein